MKKINLVTVALIVLLVKLQAQTPNGIGRGLQTNSNPLLPPVISYQVISNGPNQDVWQAVSYRTNSSGQTAKRVYSYNEIATGLNHWQNGQWVRSSEEVAVLPDGTGAATNGQHQAYYSGDIYQGGIRLAMPEGAQMAGQPVAISYDDGVNLVLLATLTNSVGVVDGANQVLYPDAFCGIHADVRYTYTKSGFEQDIILRQQPPTPESLGLNPATTRLQVLTEFFEAPTPSGITTTLAAQGGLSMTDQTLDFGQMIMVPGRAFLIGDETGSDTRFANVGKHWEQVDGRQFLVEEVPLTALASQLASLPLFSAIDSKKYRHLASKTRDFPIQRRADAASSKRALKTARQHSAEPGLVLDYNIVINNSTDVRFRGDTCYYLSGSLWLWGTTTIEGGAVFKFNPTNIDAGLKIQGPLRCLTETYRPAFFTSRDDDSVGEIIVGSTGNPMMGTNYSWAIGYSYDGEAFDVHDLQIRYFNSGVGDGVVNKTRAWTNILRNCEFYSVAYPIVGNAGVFGPTNRIDAQNILLRSVNSAFQVWNRETISAENVTMQDAWYVFRGESYPALLSLTNSLIVRMTNWLYDPGHNLSIEGKNCAIFQCAAVGARITLTDCQTNSSATGLFQAAAAGECYLSTNSPYRGMGTPNIPPALLADLRRKTTHPPIVYSNTNISTSATFDVLVQPDTNACPDLGFHYPCVDYALNRVSIDGCTLQVSNGVVISTFGTSGLQLVNGGQIRSEGTPLAPNLFVRSASVQESPSLSTNSISTDANASSVGMFRFTQFTCPAGSGNNLYHTAGSIFGTLDVQNCEFYGGANDFSGSTSNTLIALKNNLFWRSSLFASNTSSQCCLLLTNNLFWGTKVTLQSPGSNRWAAFNNNFDSCTIGGSLTNGYNAYLNDAGRLSPTNSHDRVSSASEAYQSGPLGSFYLPPDSALISSGNMAANLLGFYQFTTQTNQAKEANTTVDIGYHYVALNTNGYPMASGTSGFPDYVGDPNGMTNHLSAPSIVVQPSTQSAMIGDDVFFTVVATGGPGPYYQWYFNGNPIAGATNAVLEIDGVGTNDVGTFYVDVSNLYGLVTSRAVSLSVSTPWNYVVLRGSSTNFTFQGDSTYFVNTTVQLYGVTTIEGGAVIKYGNHAMSKLVLNGPLKSLTSIFRPALLTLRDDNSVGSSISQSTGIPSTNYYATYLVDAGGQTNEYKGLHIKFANAGIAGANSVSTWDCQFINCGTAVSSVLGNPIALHNVLISQVSNCVSTSGNVTAEFLTADQADMFCAIGYGGAALTNTILASISNTNGVNLVASVCLTNGVGVFEPVGGGGYYLAADTYQGQGTTNTSSSILADIAAKTTHPPIIYDVPEVYFSTNLFLSPQAARDINSSPDLGYHYDPIDFIIGSICVTNAVITIGPGTSIAFYSTNSIGYGIAIADNASVNFCGLAGDLVHIVEYNAVQERAVSGWERPGWAAVTQFNWTSFQMPVSFTDWSVMAQDYAFINMYGEGPFNFQNCEFHGGQVITWYTTLNFTNCLFERVNLDIEPGDSNIPVFRNNLVFGGAFGFSPWTGQSPVVKDNLFDHTVIPDWLGAWSVGYEGGHNAYVTNCDRLDPGYTNDLILLASPVYQVGKFGSYYLPSDSPLVNAGSTTADNVSLYKFTVQTNQLAEGNSIVDIGYHYVAVDLNGNPIDSNNDGIPDYLADENGNGLVDNNENVWVPLPEIASQPVSQSVIKGSNVVFGVTVTSQTSVWYQWYFNGITTAGATNAVFALTNCSVDLAGIYSVVVTNIAGSVASTDAWLAVLEPPLITMQATNQTATLGSEVTFSVIVTGSDPLSYQWLKNGLALTDGDNVYGSSSGTLVLAGVDNADAGIYSFVVSNSVGYCSSQSVTLKVLTPLNVIGWGDNQYGQTNIPGDLTNAVAISAGGFHSLAVRSDGTVVTWGNNQYGETNIPEGLNNVTAIASGGYHSLALKGDGTVVAWGAGLNGQTNVPAGLSNVLAIAAGNYYSLALKADGTVVGWGDNQYGQTNIPAYLTNVVAISAGGYHALALRSDGTVVSWGNNQYSETNIPVGLTNVVGIAAGGYHSLALKGDGTVIAWGAGLNGQTNVPAGLSNVLAIAAGNYYSLALKTDGTAVGWGDNQYGQTNIAAYLTNVAALSAGGTHVLVAGSFAPVLISPPVDITVNEGQIASFRILAAGAGLSYQWYYEDTAISNATQSVLAITNVQTAQSGHYSVTVASVLGSGSASSISRGANLMVISPATTAMPVTILDWWPGNGNTNDIIGGNNGVLQGGAGYTNGEVGMAFSFDGVDGEMAASGITGLVGNAPHSIEAWFKINQLPMNQASILLLGSQGAGSHEWLIDSNGIVHLGASGDAHANFAITVGQWIYVTVTFDGTTLVCYTNNVLQSSQPCAFDFGSDPLPLTLSHPRAGENHCNGLVDELIIYNRALSADEVTKIYTNSTVVYGGVYVGHNAIIQVVGGSIVNSVSIAMPACSAHDGAFITWQSNPIVIQADVHSAATVTNVEYFQGSQKIGSNNNSPFTCLWPGVPTGTYSITATAHLLGGGTFTSWPVTLYVNIPCGYFF